MASRTSGRLAVSIVQQCTDVRLENNMKLCKLPLEKNTADFSKTSSIVKRYSLGKPNPFECNTSKTILLTGATGSGKTTWINAMVNYVLGVEWDDPFRFVLIDEDVRGGSQANSQTQEVTVYDLHYQNGFQIPFSLTIVDTPGFGDTGGIARDKEITSAIEKLFKDENGIEVCVFSDKKKEKISTQQLTNTINI
jgi:septin family protein